MCTTGLIKQVLFKSVTCSKTVQIIEINIVEKRI